MDDAPELKKKRPPRPMVRLVRKREPRASRIAAYDFETERIAAGTPRPLYITAHGHYIEPRMHFESRIEDMAHLQKILVNHFLIDEYTGTKFVAWNGNNFDAYYVAAALVTHPDFLMRPYLTRTKSLRGVRIIRREDVDKRNAPSWEFLDGIAMLGLVGVRLEKFLATFAPDYPKMTDAVDFDIEDFDAESARHRAYAMRDSEGLDHAMNRAQRILLDNFDQPLAVTMGGACIRILKAHLPDDVIVRAPLPELETIIRQYAMRGGYCFCVRRFEGPVWKYDLNQAYASAMRETLLPSGYSFHTTTGVHKFARVYVARITATNPGNRVPFYCRAMQGGRLRSLFAMAEIPETWLTSIEVRQLQAEGWNVRVFESHAWEDVFTLQEFVDKLEVRRMAAEGGPSGPEGTIYKCVGNHSYGKTLEELEPVEYVISAACPPGFVPAYPDDDSPDPLPHIFERKSEDDTGKDYHQPQIGAFITAHVRMVVRRAALIDPDAWLYADTDCVVFSRDITAMLDIDPKRYGAWKVEEAGTVYQIIAKKVYASTEDEKKRSAKGLHVRKLTPGQFSEWLAGTPPVQDQVQRQNFMRVMRGGEMFRAQRRSGTAVAPTPSETSGAVSSRVTEKPGGK